MKPIVKSLAPQHGYQAFALTDDAIVLGRDASCRIVFKEDTPGISRKHCALTWDADKQCFVLMDLGSSYGTYLKDGTKLQPKKAYRLQPGDCFYLAEPTNMILLDVEEGSEPQQNIPAKSRTRLKPGIALIVAAALVVLALLFCLTGHLVGNARMKSGDYSGAYKAYRVDALFSRGDRIEAALLAGESCFAEKDYTAAAEYFRTAGEKGAARLCDVLCEQAKLLIKEGKPEEAIALLSEFSDKPQAKEQIGLAQLAIAEEQLKSGALDDAIRTAESIEKAGSADPVPFLNRAYCMKAGQLLDENDYQGAANAYGKCKGDPSAEQDAGILTMLLNKDFFPAAEAADAALLKNQTNLTRERWSDIVYQMFGKVNDSDVEKRLERGSLMAILRKAADRSPAKWKTEIKAALPVDEKMVGGSVSSLEGESNLDLFALCGKEPKGKVLFVMESCDYPDKNKTQVVLYDLMDLLPKEFYPRSLGEVEYLARLSYDYSHDGRYQYLTIALREKAQMEVFQLPKKNRVYNSGTIYGEHAPSSFWYTGSPPKWESGGAPDMIDKVYEALMAAMKE